MFEIASCEADTARPQSKARRTVPTDTIVMRPLPDQLSILAETFSKAAKLPMTEPKNRAALKSLALATLFSLDALSSQMTPR